MFKDLTIDLKLTKLTEENIGECLIGLGSDFMDMTPKEQTAETKVNE